jgi:hypothetical protein
MLVYGPNFTHVTDMVLLADFVNIDVMPRFPRVLRCAIHETVIHNGSVLAALQDHVDV